MQDPDQTIPVPQGYDGQGQTQMAPGQYPQQPGSWPPAQQPYPQQPYPQQPGQGNYNAAPGQFPGYQPGPQYPQGPRAPQRSKRRGLLFAIIGVVVLLVLVLGGFFAFIHKSAQKSSTANTTTASSTTHVATAQASQSSSGKNASANSSAQSSASSNGNTSQAQATAAVGTAEAQATAQGTNPPSQAQVLALAGPPSAVAKSFFTAIQNQDYNTAYQYTSFKRFTSDTFHSTSTTSDQTLGKLTGYTLGKTTIYPGTNTVNAQVAVTISRTNVPSHSGLAMLVLEGGKWKITDGTVWQ